MEGTGNIPTVAFPAPPLLSYLPFPLFQKSLADTEAVFVCLVLTLIQTYDVFSIIGIWGGWRSLSLAHEVPAVSAWPVHDLHVSLSERTGLLLFSPTAFNHVMWSISFAAFYYRFLVAIKMLLKSHDFSVPCPTPICTALLWWLHLGVSDTQGHVLAMEMLGLGCRWHYH